jgi:PAS domain-containing protein
MAQGVVYQSADGGILSANPAAERILGLTSDQMMGMTSHHSRWRTIHEDGSELPGSDHPSMIALRTGKPVGPVIMGVFNPMINDYVWISVNAIPLFENGDAQA